MISERWWVLATGSGYRSCAYLFGIAKSIYEVNMITVTRLLDVVSYNGSWMTDTRPQVAIWYRLCHRTADRTCVGSAGHIAVLSALCLCKHSIWRHGHQELLALVSDTGAGVQVTSDTRTCFPMVTQSPSTTSPASTT